MHDHRDVRVLFYRRLNKVTQKWCTGIGSRTRRSLHDYRRVSLISGLHDGLHLLHIVNIKSRASVLVFCGMVKKLT